MTPRDPSRADFRGEARAARGCGSAPAPSTARSAGGPVVPDAPEVDCELDRLAAALAALLAGWWRQHGRRVEAISDQESFAEIGDGPVDRVH
jgi:hypothetical protein